MTLEQKIKEIEGFVDEQKGRLLKVNRQEALAVGVLLSEYVPVLNKALEVIREQQKQLDRVRDTERLDLVIKYAARETGYILPEGRHITQELQNYILGGEGE